MTSALQLKKWFLLEKRDLPWRNVSSPYAVWISEIMLQQTQVAVVIPYFERWMERFPDLEALASASLDEVIKMWEGLGYYSRARHLHEGAKYILSHFGGEFPSTEKDLNQIKGLGPYTIGAIRGFAFHQKAAAVDGNVLRVISRYFLVKDDISKTKTVNHIRELVFSFLPDEEPWIVNEALIELGATVCTRKPNCLQCPLKKSCQAYLHGETAQLPFNSKKFRSELLQRAVAVIECEGHYLIQRGEKGKIMSDLHEFPYFEVDSPDFEIVALTKKHFALETVSINSFSMIEHSFTRFRVKLYPVHLHTNEKKEIPGYQWVPQEKITHLAFSSGHRKLVHLLVGKES